MTHELASLSSAASLKDSGLVFDSLSLLLHWPLSRATIFKLSEERDRFDNLSFSRKAIRSDHCAPPWTALRLLDSQNVEAQSLDSSDS